MAFPPWEIPSKPGAAAACGCTFSAGLSITPGSQIKPNQQSDLLLKESSVQGIGPVRRYRLSLSDDGRGVREPLLLLCVVPSISEEALHVLSYFKKTVS